MMRGGGERHRVDLGVEAVTSDCEAIVVELCDERGELVGGLDTRRILSLDVALRRLQLLFRDALLVEALEDVERHVDGALGRLVLRVGRDGEGAAHLALVEGGARAVGSRSCA